MAWILGLHGISRHTHTPATRARPLFISHRRSHVEPVLSGDDSAELDHGDGLPVDLGQSLASGPCREGTRDRLLHCPTGGCVGRMPLV